MSSLAVSIQSITGQAQRRKQVTRKVGKSQYSHFLFVEIALILPEISTNLYRSFVYGTRIFILV